MVSKMGLKKGNKKKDNKLIDANGRARGGPEEFSKRAWCEENIRL